MFKAILEISVNYTIVVLDYFND